MSDKSNVLKFVIGSIIYAIIVWQFVSISSRLTKLEKTSHAKGEMEVTINVADGTNCVGKAIIK